MKRGQKLSRGTQRAAAIRQRNYNRKFHEFQKNSRQKNRPKKSSNKYSKNDSFTQLLKILWKAISKILQRF